MVTKLRELFLQEFTKSLITNSRKEGYIIREVMPFHPVKIEQKNEIEIKQIPQIIIQKTKPLLIPSIRPIIQIPQMRMPQTPVQKTTMPSMLPIQAQMVSPFPTTLPNDFNLGKIHQMANDNKVTNIECPGPGKAILVRHLGKINLTQIILNEEEIKKVIETFSKAAKIPPMTGIFKAAVGNLVITAVISDFVGSRFIINKYTPYSVLENQQPPQPSLR